MLGGVCRRLAGFYLFDDRADPIHHPLVPVLLLVGGLPSHNEGPVGTGAVAHIGEATQRAIDQIAHLNDPAGLMEGTVKGVWSGAPAPWHCRFGAVLISRRRSNRRQIGVLDSGLEILPDTEPDAIHDRRRHLQAIDLVLIFYASGFKHCRPGIDDIFDARAIQRFPGDAVEPAQPQLLAQQAAGLELLFDIGGKLLRLILRGLQTRRAGEP